MNILRQARPFFAPSVRNRGEQYDRQNRVELESVEPGNISAQVEGSSSRYYSVRLRWADEDPLFLLAVCTCPHYQSGEFCKHLWATLRIFEDGFWGFEGEDRQVVLQHELDLEDEELAAEPEPASKRKEPTSRRVSPRTTGHSWSSTLNAVVLASSPAGHTSLANLASEPERQMWLVVNPKLSKQSGSLVVDFFFRQRKRDGSFGKVRREGVSRADLFRYPDAEDRRLLSLLLGNEPIGELNGYHDDWANQQGRRHQAVRIPSEMHDLLLPALCATRRLVWSDFEFGKSQSPPLDQLHALDWSPRPSWRLEVQAVPPAAAGAGNRGDGWSLRGQLACGDKSLSPQAAVLALEDGLVVFKDHISHLDPAADAAWVDAFSQSLEQYIPAGDRDAFISHWWTLPHRPTAQLPAELVLSPTGGVPRGCISVEKQDGRRFGFSAECVVAVSFQYGKSRVEPNDDVGAVIDLAAGHYISRDLDRERELLEQLRQFGVKWHSDYYEEGWHSVSATRIDALTSALLELGWHVEFEGAVLRGSTGFELEINSGIDWFDLEAEVSFGGQRIDLPALLEARATGSRHITLGDGTIGLLPEAWLDEYDRIASLGTMENGRLRMRHTQATMLDALLRDSEDSRLRVDDRFKTWRERLNRVDGIVPASEPSGFKGELRPYQRVGLGWLAFLDDIAVGGCLADDMGLGKTVQIIALLLVSREQSNEHSAQHSGPSIVVVPRSLVWNWCSELARFGPSLSVLEYGGPQRQRHLEELASYNVVVTTYGTLRRDISKLRTLSFDYAILDEAQAIKNAQSQAAKACRLLNARQRLAITGTPIENHLGELWSLFEFLNPGLLGSSKAFDSLAKGSGRTSTEAAQTLSTGLRPFILRRTKDEVLPDLPSKTEQTLFCDLPAEQRELYDELRDYYRRLLDQKIDSVGLGRAKIHVLEALLRLRQTACHPGLVDPARANESSAKLSLLMDRLDDVVAEGHKALVFSQFTSLLSIVRKAVESRAFSYEYLDGRTRNRQKRVDQFQSDPDCSLFLISLKAGGHGLNLTAADYVFILDPWWNPAVEAQAIDRAHRIGQERSVFAYRLIAKDTVEEKIMQLQSQKRALADAIVAADESLIRRLSPDDLSILLG